MRELQSVPEDDAPNRKHRGSKNPSAICTGIIRKCAESVLVGSLEPLHAVEQTEDTHGHCHYCWNPCENFTDNTVLGITSLCFFHIGSVRSEEHTSELQSRSQLVCSFLIEKKKNKDQQNRS